MKLRLDVNFNLFRKVPSLWQSSRPTHRKILAPKLEVTRMSQNRDCGRRTKFEWKHVNKRKSELTYPKQCKPCADENEQQFDYCMKRSFEATGRDPKDLPTINLMINMNPEADKAAERNQKKLERLAEKVQSHIEEQPQATERIAQHAAQEAIEQHEEEE
jgi:hypothetical protein